MLNLNLLFYTLLILVSCFFTATTLMNAVADPLIKFSLSTAVDELFQTAEFKTRIHKFLVGNYTNYQGFPTYTNQSVSVS